MFVHHVAQRPVLQTLALVVSIRQQYTVQPGEMLTLPLRRTLCTLWATWALTWCAASGCLLVDLGSEGGPDAVITHLEGLVERWVLRRLALPLQAACHMQSVSSPFPTPAPAPARTQAPAPALPGHLPLPCPGTYPFPVQAPLSVCSPMASILFAIIASWPVVNCVRCLSPVSARKSLPRA